MSYKYKMLSDMAKIHRIAKQYIWEISGSDLSVETVCPDWGFSWFF
jgi:hypothetical protein